MTGHNKYIYTISSSKRVKMVFLNRTKKKKKPNCKDISIATAPACQGNQLPQYCQPFLEFPKWKKRGGEKETTNSFNVMLWSLFVLSFLLTSSHMTQLKLMEELLFKQATQQHRKIYSSYRSNSTNFSYICFKKHYKKSSLRFYEIQQHTPYFHTKNIDAIYKK